MRKMNETKEEVDVDYDEGHTFVFHFDLDIKKVIVGWTLLLVTYFALSLESYNWNTLLLQTAIVVGAGMLILVIYERAGGNIVELPTVNWKGLMQNIIGIIIIVASIVIGAATLILGFMWMYELFPYYELRVILTLILLGFGAAMLILAYQELKKLFGENEEKPRKIDKDTPLMDESTEVKELITEDAAGAKTNESD